VQLVLKIHWLLAPDVQSVREYEPANHRGQGNPASEDQDVSPHGHWLSDHSLAEKKR
jgi:hypothetical protein